MGHLPSPFPAVSQTLGGFRRDPRAPTFPSLFKGKRLPMKTIGKFTVCANFPLKTFQGNSPAFSSSSCARVLLECLLCHFAPQQALWRSCQRSQYL